MKILIIEDNAQHIEAARHMLSEHELTIVSGYDQARKLLAVEEVKTKETCAIRLQKYPDGQMADWDKEKVSKPHPVQFDVVLTDCMIPKGGYECMNEAGKLQADKGPVPYGPILALTALQVGVKRVGVITAGNHHEDPFVFAFDSLYGFVVGDRRVILTNSLLSPVDANFKELDPWGSEKGIWVKNWRQLLKAVMADDVQPVEVTELARSRTGW